MHDDTTRWHSVANHTRTLIRTQDAGILRNQCPVACTVPLHHYIQGREDAHVPAVQAWRMCAAAGKSGRLMRLAARKRHCTGASVSCCIPCTQPSNWQDIIWISGAQRGLDSHATWRSPLALVHGLLHCLREHLTESAAARPSTPSLQTEEVLSPRNPRRHQLGVASLWGWSMGTLVWGHQSTQA